MRAVFIRHLPTAWNKEGRLQGRRDIPIDPLTKTLESEIAENKRQLAEGPPAGLVLASTLQRTKKTAEMYGFFPVEEPLLDELDFGPFEGRTKAELLQSIGPAWADDPRPLLLGESIGSLEQRIRLFLEKYSGHERVLVFGHGAWIRAMLSVREYGDARAMNKMAVGNNELIRLEGGRRWLRN